jgi:hypothetical protein
MTCDHKWSEITTITEEKLGLRRFICLQPHCYAEMTEPPTN